MMFSEERIAQMTAYLLKLSGGRESYLKLMKLLYLADREYMSRFGDSISGDRMVSMPKGPVLSQTLECFQSDCRDGWSDWIRGESNYEVALNRQFEREDLDELNDVQLRTLANVHEQFKDMGRYEICDYTHDHCKEWEDPQGSSFPINPETLFRAVGKSESEARELANSYFEQRHLERITRSL